MGAAIKRAFQLHEAQIKKLFLMSESHWGRIFDEDLWPADEPAANGLAFNLNNSNSLIDSVNLLETPAEIGPHRPAVTHSFADCSVFLENINYFSALCLAKCFDCKI